VRARSFLLLQDVSRNNLDLHFIKQMFLIKLVCNI
jgi:hypothetical protein